MKYKVGDKIIIKDYHTIRKMSQYKNSGPPFEFIYDSFTPEMVQFCGKEVTIKAIDINDEYSPGPMYKIEEDCEDYNFYESWFFPSTRAGKVLFGNKNAKT